MSVLRTSLRVMRVMWPLFLILGAMIAVFDQFSASSGAFGAKLVVTVMMVHYIHHAILSGHINIWTSQGADGAKLNLSFRFFWVFFVLVIFPALFGLILFFVFGPGTIESSINESIMIIFMLVPTWLSLTFFGTRIPKLVWTNLHGHDGELGTQQRSVWVYIATRLLMWNLIYFVLVIMLLVALGAMNNSALGESIPYFETASNAIMEAFSYVAAALTASVLSHAFLRAYDLGPQGLVERP